MHPQYTILITVQDWCWLASLVQACHKTQTHTIISFQVSLGFLGSFQVSLGCLGSFQASLGFRCHTCMNVAASWPGGASIVLTLTLVDSLHRSTGETP